MTAAHHTPHCGLVTDADNGWQPIATSPRDGSPHLIFCPEKKAVLSVVYDEATADWWQIYVEAPMNRSIVLDGNFGEPSHWMPLPPPPEDWDNYQASRKTALDAADALRQFVAKAYAPGHIAFDLIAVIESAIPKEAQEAGSAK